MSIAISANSNANAINSIWLQIDAHLPAASIDIEETFEIFYFSDGNVVYHTTACHGFEFPVSSTWGRNGFGRGNEALAAYRGLLAIVKRWVFKHNRSRL